MKIVLIHGKNTDPTEKWYPWLKEEVIKNGFDFIAPILPRPEDPVMDEWLVEIDKTNPEDDTILIGHSRGGVAVLRWLEKQKEIIKVRKVILVATNSGRLRDKPIANETNYGFYTEEGYDFKKIKNHCREFIVLHSQDDPWVPFSAGQFNAQGLSAKFLKFENYEHFGAKTKKIPELLEEIISGQE
ncbi:MAG: alpha/beta hydrolase [Candidatus Falkowbacteria bacterium]|nr:alpha/beta hydrolase [Candidatus Falkowbacteria bacterium]